MLHKYTLALFFCLITMLGYAQHVAPKDLIQMHKLWQMNDPHCDKNTYDYLMTVDKNWALQTKPTLDKAGFTMLLGYSKDGKSWYQPEECHIMVSLEVGQPNKKSILYGFTEVDTWNEYNKQMLLMNADKLGSGPSQGGVQTIYTVNDIAFILTDFPPGVMGTDRCYQVSVMVNNTK